MADLPVPPGYEDYKDDPDLSELEEFRQFMVAGGAGGGSSGSASTPAATASGYSNPVPPAATQARKGSGLLGEEEATLEIKSWRGEGAAAAGDADDVSFLDIGASFEDLGLSENLLKGVLEMGFVKPAKIQAAALPFICHKNGKIGQNMIGQAQNGSGKTATFALSLLSAIDVSVEEPQAVVICPTRELARQSEAVVAELGQYLPIKTLLVVPSQDRVPRKPRCHVLVGTPGKMVELVKKGILDGSAVKVFVLDEADVMLDQQNAMGPQVTQLRKLLPTEAQVLFFSATFPDDVRQFAEGLVPRAISIKVKKTELTVSTVTQMYMECENEADKFKKTMDLYGAMSVGQSVIFVNARRKAFNLAQKMRDGGFAVSLICGTQQTWLQKLDPDEIRNRLWNTGDFRDWNALSYMRLDQLREELQHRGGALSDEQMKTMGVEELRARLRLGGGFSETQLSRMGDEQLRDELRQRASERMDPKLRDQVMDEFRAGVTRVLIATDVLSRGIDVPQVTLVINYELPLTWPERKANMETYLHRVGRTGRFGLRGLAVSLVSADGGGERHMINDICEFFQCSIEQMDQDFEALEERLRFLR